MAKIRYGLILGKDFFMRRKLFLSLTALISLLALNGCGGNTSSITSSDSSIQESSSVQTSLESSSSLDSSSIITSESIKDKYDCISIERAIELAGTEKDYVTSEKYYVYGTIKSIDNPTYGQMTITDGTFSISVYGSYALEGDKQISYSELEDKPVAGDEIVLYGEIGYFNAPEMKKSQIMEFVHHRAEVDESYEESTIANARESESGSKFILSGVVAKITYANGMKPNGFYLVDNTGSIYIYGNQVAPQVSVGNMVKVAGEKTFYINPDEANNAQKYNYLGSCQIQSPTLLENDKEVHQFDTSWIEKTTIKNLMEREPSENFMTQIYQANALIKKVPGDGFINYYINDIDGETGSYVYTACNGSDFAYLDEYDGKLVTMYLSVINAKSTASGCIYRFMPISIIDDNYVFDVANAAEYAVTYHGLTQFFDQYSGDPALEVVTNVSSELLKFENVVLSYSSSNTSVINFVNEDDKVVMHAVDSGTAEITVTGTHLSNQYSGKMTISVVKSEAFDYISVKDAIEAELDTDVIVKGIVGPSVVNKTGFYLIDETGAIAVTTDGDSLSKLKPGNEIVVTGKRVMFNSSDSYVGQSCLLDIKVLANNYGEHEYSTKSFDNTKTLADLVAYPVNEDHTAQVYSLSATISKTSSPYSTNYSLTDGTNTLGLYSGSGKQYAMLEDYVDQTVEVEVALCNWNKKTSYRGCVLSVTVNGNKILNNLNFQQ